MQGGNKVVYHKELSYEIIGVMYEVYNELGYGYQEKYYGKAIEKSFLRSGIKFRSQVPYKIVFKREVVGRYFLDFLVENKIVVEIKKGRYFSKRNIEQVKGYLRATKLQLAILVNFTPNNIKFFRVLNPLNQYPTNDL
ncbi:MAG TPA: GxxExxY protein [Patescibacteria group bacterium]|nr:GxxExxY protein [Patescibacteria group bacterium]